MLTTGKVDEFDQAISKEDIVEVIKKIRKQEEHLDYGEVCNLLDHDSDFIVIGREEPREVADQWVTHWCEIPESLLVR